MYLSINVTFGIQNLNGIVRVLLHSKLNQECTNRNYFSSDVY